MKSGFAPERLLPFAALGGAALLIGSQFLSVFELKSAGDVLQATVSGADQHWFSMALFGLLAAVSVVGAVATGSRPLAVTVAVCGLVALLLFLVSDLPDAGRSDSVNTTAGALVIAEAHPAGGFLGRVDRGLGLDCLWRSDGDPYRRSTQGARTASVPYGSGTGRSEEAFGRLCTGSTVFLPETAKALQTLRSNGRAAQTQADCQAQGLSQAQAQAES